MSDAVTVQVHAALRTVMDPETGQDLVTAGRIADITQTPSGVRVVIETPPGAGFDAYGPVKSAVEAALASGPGGQVILTAHAGSPPRAAPARRHALRQDRPTKGVRLSAAAQADAAPRAGPAAQRLTLPGVRHIIAVASGKGGVGKSTVAANLACALAAQGLAVGLLDADVYGPSAPIMMGLSGADPKAGGDQKLVPPSAFGVKVMSIGFLVDADAPMIWRGPMVMSAITQMLSDVAWAPLDVLVIDLPPGTGDAQLTLVQRVALDGAVIVSTPQEIALADVRRGVSMFRRTEAPILGVVENMSAMTDPATGVRLAPFGEGGARRAAQAMEAPFLGALPLDADLAALSDAGTPPAATAIDTPMGRAFHAIAQEVRQALSVITVKQAPLIVVE